MRQRPDKRLASSPFSQNAWRRIIALSGELGTGKTFTQAVAKYLGLLLQSPAPPLLSVNITPVTTQQLKS